MAAEVDNMLRVVLEGMGWDIYNKIVLLITSLGLHYVPFIAVLLKNWWETRSSQEAGIASIVEWRRNYFDVYSMMFVVIFFFIPSSSTQMSSAEMAGNLMTGNSGDYNISSQKYDVPIGWWVVFKMGNATVAQLKEWIGTGEDYLRMLETFNTAQITNDQLKVEVTRFYNECYLPTYSRWRRETHTPIPTPVEGDDMLYLGNQLFVNTAGYYKSCDPTTQANNACYGSNENMPMVMAKQLGMETEFTTKLNDGTMMQYTDTPSCYTWWTGKSDISYNGNLAGYESLRSKLIQHAVNKWLATNPNKPLGQYGSKDSLYPANEQFLMRMLKNDPPDLDAMKDEVNNSERSFWEMIKDGITTFIASMGSTILALLFEVAIQILVPFIYMLHALMIFVFIFALPVIMLFSAFRPGIVINLIIFLFGLLFLGVIWHIADLLYNNLIKIMLGGNEYSMFESMSLKETQMQLLFFIYLFFVYIYIPKYVMSMASAAGIKWQDVTDDALDASSKSQSSLGTPIKAGISRFGVKSEKTK
jgi:hypothetical protein